MPPPRRSKRRPRRRPRIRRRSPGPEDCGRGPGGVVGGGGKEPPGIRDGGRVTSPPSFFRNSGTEREPESGDGEAERGKADAGAPGRGGLSPGRPSGAEGRETPKGTFGVSCSPKDPRRGAGLPKGPGRLGGRLAPGVGGESGGRGGIPPDAPLRDSAGLPGAGVPNAGLRGSAGRPRAGGGWGLGGDEGSDGGGGSLGGSPPEPGSSAGRRRVESGPPGAEGAGGRGEGGGGGLPGRPRVPSVPLSSSSPGSFDFSTGRFSGGGPGSAMVVEVGVRGTPGVYEEGVVSIRETTAFTRAPSARPRTFAMTSFMIAPTAAEPSPPWEAMTSRTTCSSSASVSASGR